MDFSTTEAAQDLGGLVDTIVDSVCTPEHQRELDKLDQRFDRKLWSKLIDSDILTSAAATQVGGINTEEFKQMNRALQRLDLGIPVSALCCHSASARQHS